jgi:excisionase family DNA binding protein
MTPDCAMNTPETAAYIGCKPSTLRNWKLQGKGPQYYKVGRLVRYRRADLDKWIEAQKRGRHEEMAVAV